LKKNDDRIPDYYYSSFHTVDFDMLYERGYSNLLVDVDNTIANRDSDEVEEKAGNKILELLSEGRGWKICLVSNIIFGKKREMRVKKIADSLGLSYVTAMFFDRKPKPAPFLKGMDILQSRSENTAIIGDQIFTDIIGGNRLGLLTVLIKPLGPDHWTTTLMGSREKEKKILDVYNIIV